VPPISTKEVEKIAQLANLRFSPEELERFISQFQDILDYIAQLEAISTEGVEPTYHALEQEELVTPMREDVPGSSLPVETTLENAPDSTEDHFRVPAVIEG
jgi:aspartyl-tRNA(Asn)/glutamyl-tRNA(Gln) amidotransferase subunit C